MINLFCDLLVCCFGRQCTSVQFFVVDCRFCIFLYILSLGAWCFCKEMERKMMNKRCILYLVCWWLDIFASVTNEWTRSGVMAKMEALVDHIAFWSKLHVLHDLLWLLGDFVDFCL